MEKNKLAKYHLEFNDSIPLEEMDLIQIGRMHCWETTVVKKHMHLDWYELTVVTDGSGVVYTGDVGVNVARGDIYLSYPCDAHGICSDPHTPLSFDFFAFRPRSSRLKSALNTAVEKRLDANQRVIQDQRISYLVSNAIAERMENTPESHELLSAFSKLITSYLLRDLDRIYAKMPPAHVDAAQALCFRLMNYIDTHLYTNENLSSLSKLTGYNYSHLSTLFKKHTKTSLFAYRQSKRLEAAKILLKENQRSVGQIADLLGYSSAYAFSKAYRQHFGVSPSLHRTQDTPAGK